MRTLRPTLFVALAALALAASSACGGERGAAVPAGGAEASAGAPAQPPAAEEAAPLDSAGIAAAMAEDDSLEAENRRTFEERRRSMGTYEQCMAQARQLPEGESRARIERACESRREGS